MNILITSVGRRGYIVKYFKEVLKGQGEVHAANNNLLNPSFHHADKYVVTPNIYDSSYIDFLINYCKNNKITLIIPLFDVDLPVLAKNITSFEKENIKVLVSSFDIINICNDKYATYQFLVKNGFNTPNTFVDIHEVKRAIQMKMVNFPIIIKPRWGMGSIGIYVAENFNELDVLYNKTYFNILNSYLKYESKEKLDECVLMQEMIKGQEYGLDIINNLSGKYMNTIVKMKYSMRSGETDAAVTVNDLEMKKLGQKLSTSLKHIGNLDVDLFKDGETLYILEMNARIGGGYPFSHMAGVNFPKAIKNWIEGDENFNESLFEKYDVVSHKELGIVKLGDRKLYNP